MAIIRSFADQHLKAFNQHVFLLFQRVLVSFSKFKFIFSTFLTFLTFLTILTFTNFSYEFNAE